jgi:hypothetical protein
VRRRLARKSQRGTTVVIVVMVTTLVMGIGVFAVKNASQIDQAVGYSRLSSQTEALAELGTTAAISEFGASKAALLVDQMERQPEDCYYNRLRPAYPMPVTCYRLYRDDLDQSIGAFNNGPLFVAPVAGTEVGSFGPVSGMSGDVYVEVTEKGPTGRPVAGTDVGGTSTAQKFAKVTLTTTGQVRLGGDVCEAGVAAVASKKVMRARVVVGPI